jgi:hypothetical protein
MPPETMAPELPALAGVLEPAGGPDDPQNEEIHG